MLGPFAILAHPTALIVYAVVALIGIIHHDGDKRGYARHEAEVAEAIRETNKGLARANKEATATIDKQEVARQVEVRTIIETVEVPVQVPGPVQIVNGQCGLPADVIAKLNRIK